MHTHHFNFDEFPNTSTEEEVTIAIASKHEFDSPADFFAACNWTHTGELPSQHVRIPLAEYGHRSTLCEYLNRFVPSTPFPIDSTTVIEICSEWDEMEIVLETPRHYACYHWQTSA